MYILAEVRERGDPLWGIGKFCVDGNASDVGYRNKFESAKEEWFRKYGNDYELDHFIGIDDVGEDV